MSELMNEMKKVKSQYPFLSDKEIIDMAKITVRMNRLLDDAEKYYITGHKIKTILDEAAAIMATL